MTLACIAALAAGVVLAVLWCGCSKRGKCPRWCVISGCIVELPLPDADTR